MRRRTILLALLLPATPAAGDAGRRAAEAYERSTTEHRLANGMTFVHSAMTDEAETLVGVFRPTRPEEQVAPGAVHAEIFWRATPCPGDEAERDRLLAAEADGIDLECSTNPLYSGCKSWLAPHQLQRGLELLVAGLTAKSCMESFERVAWRSTLYEARTPTSKGSLAFWSVLYAAGDPLMTLHGTRGLIAAKTTALDLAQLRSRQAEDGAGWFAVAVGPPLAADALRTAKDALARLRHKVEPRALPSNVAREPTTRAAPYPSTDYQRDYAGIDLTAALDGGDEASEAVARTWIADLVRRAKVRKQASSDAKVHTTGLDTGLRHGYVGFSLAGKRPDIDQLLDAALGLAKGPPSAADLAAARAAAVARFQARLSSPPLRLDEVARALAASDAGRVGRLFHAVDGVGEAQIAAAWRRFLGDLRLTYSQNAADLADRLRSVP